MNVISELKEILLADIEEQVSKDWDKLIEIRNKAHDKARENARQKKSEFCWDLINNGYTKAVANICERGVVEGKALIKREINKKVEKICAEVTKKIGEAVLEDGYIRKVNLFTDGCILRFKDVDGTYFVIDLRAIVAYGPVVRPHTRVICTKRKIK